MSGSSTSDERHPVTGETLWDRYARLAAVRPSDVAVVDDRGRSLSHEQLADASRRVAAALGEAGVRRDDLVLVIMPNTVEWQVVFAATLRLGAVPMTIPITTETSTLTYLCDLADVSAVVTVDGSIARSMLDMVAEAVAASARPATIMAVGDLATTRVLGPSAAGGRTGRIGELAHVMTTSSTTGRPKAVVHSEATLAALNHGFAERFELRRETPIFMASPLGHSVGAIHGARLSMYLAAPLVLQERWDPERAMDIVHDHHCNFTCAATPFLKDLIDAATPADRHKLTRLRTFLCGGAAVPPVLMDRADHEFPETFVSVLWGMTEGGVTTSRFDTTREQRHHTAGCGLPGLDMRVVDPDLVPLPVGEIGELVMRGPGVFTGYLRQDDLYRDSLTPDGFFRTGDLARLDADGYLHLTGRLKDLVIRGGVNISPVVTEDALAGHPRVSRVAVVGEPDERLGERLCAVVVTNDGADLAFDDVIEWVSAQGLPRRQWPESVRRVDRMPVTAAGKIRKNQLRDELFGGDR